jgi:hypothetical protein
MVKPPYRSRFHTLPEAASVPFMSDWHDMRPFSDIPANVGVTDARHMLEGWTRTRQKAAQGKRLEAQVGDWNTVPASLLELLARYRRAVARIVIPSGQVDYRNLRVDAGWTGTGFLVAPNLLVTNHHVLNSVAVAGSAVVEFDYEWPSDKLFANDETAEPTVARFELTPTRLFLTSPVNGKGLDYSFIWISEKAAEHFGTIRMERGSFMINQYEPTYVIHHPRGRLKEVSLDDTELLAVNSVNILYAADTDYGSSGACVFNRNGRLVALHHAFQSGEMLKQHYPDVVQQLSDGRPVTVGNEGIKISAIAIDLEARMRGGGADAGSAAEILSQIDGSDTLTGIFGGIGRRSAAPQNVDRVREIYLGSDQDIDIGFWKLNWLPLGHEAGRVENAVTAMADLNQDLWCLTDVPPSAVAELVRSLCKRFGEVFQAEFSEPDAESRQLVTAVIWRPETVCCTKVGWPAAVAEAWTRVVPDLEGSDPVFRTAPGLFQVGRANGAALVNLVPISLRSIRGDELRRRLASKLLVRAIDLTPSKAGDWVIGGDYEPPLAHRDSQTLLVRDYEIMSLADRGRGSAISYLRAPSSGIRNVFVTSDMALLDNRRDFFEVMPDRTVDRFIRKLADSRPAVLRLSLGIPGEATSDDRLDQILDATLAPNPAFHAAPTPHRATGVGPGPWHQGLAWRGLDKRGFLATNRMSLSRLLADVAVRQGQDYPDLAPLTQLDLWVITFVEAGLGPGGVDPDFRHSLGEIGLFPLPNNISYWIGPDAPAWNRPMKIEKNIESYLLYLGQIRNKTVTTAGGRKLYRDLFRGPGIASSPERQARLLAGIVHGYFVSGNYHDHQVPVDDLLSSFANDEPINKLLNGTGYVHAGSTILTNRQRNVDASIAAFRLIEAV